MKQEFWCGSRYTMKRSNNKKTEEVEWKSEITILPASENIN